MIPRIPSLIIGLPASVRRAAIAIALGALVVACAPSSGTASPAGATGPSASPSVAAGSPSAGAVQPTPVPDTPAPSVNNHGAPAIEAMLPAKVGTVALERLSLTGPDFYALGTDATRAQLDAMLGKLGKKVTDLTVADAGDPRGLTVIEIGIFRVADAAADRLLSEWVASTVASNPGQIATSSVTVDGRKLTKLVDSSRPVGGVTYAFVKGDTLFAIAADDPALLSSALSQLPTP